MLLTVTSVYTAVFSLLIVYLSLSISMHYAKAGTTQADPNAMKDETLRRKTRAHGNFIEYVPLALILLAMLEISGEHRAALWLMGGAFVLARVIHAYGQRFTDTPVLRAIGMMMGHLYFVAGAVRLAILNV